MIKGTHHTDESKLKMSKSLKGRKLTPEHCRNMGLGHIGIRRPPCSEKTRQKMSESHKGCIILEETKRKISEKLRGKKRPPEVGIKVSKAITGRHWTPEHRLSVMKGMKDIWKSPEWRMKISLAHKGKPHFQSQETKAKIKASNIKFWSEHKELAKERGRKTGNTERGRKLPPEWVEKVASKLRGKKRGPYSEEWRRNLSLSHIGKSNVALIGKPHSFERRLKERESQIKRIERQIFNGGPISPCVGNFEKQILDRLEQTQNIKLIRQHKVIGYFIDGYCEETNTVYEVDEPYHYYTGSLSKRDLVREEDIKKVLGCSFVRIKTRRRRLTDVFPLVSE